MTAPADLRRAVGREYVTSLRRRLREANHEAESASIAWSARDKVLRTRYRSRIDYMTAQRDDLELLLAERRLAHWTVEVQRFTALLTAAHIEVSGRP